MALTTVWATTKLVGFHCWPEAPENRDYLRSRHRHEFHVTAWVKVSHEDRDVEFHDLREIIRSWWGEGDQELGRSSCETLANRLNFHLASQGFTVTAVQVSEDGYEGAHVDYTRD